MTPKAGIHRSEQNDKIDLVTCAKCETTSQYPADMDDDRKVCRVCVIGDVELPAYTHELVEDPKTGKKSTRALKKPQPARGGHMAGVVGVSSTTRQVRASDGATGEAGAR